MNEKIDNTTDSTTTLKFKDQKEAFHRIENRSSFYVMSFLIIAFFTTTVFTNRYPHIGEDYITIRICYWITSVTPLILFIINILLFEIPKFSYMKPNNNEESYLNRDYIKIAHNLLNPSTTGYKINRIIRIFSIVSGILFFIANIILIFIITFMF